MRSIPKSGRARTGVLITVRTSSSRLPRKALSAIGGRTVVEHVIRRAAQVRNADCVVVCTSTDPADDVLMEYALDGGVLAFRGSLDDKLVRWRDAAAHFDLDYFIEYDGDDVFCDPELMGLALDQMRDDPCDALIIPDSLVVGASAFCLSRDAVARAADLHHESVDNWVPHFTGTGLFRTRGLAVGDPVFHDKDIRLTLDYEEDLTFFRRVFTEMEMTENVVPARDIIQFLELRRDIAALNWFRQVDYLRNRERLASIVLHTSTEKTERT